MMNRSSSRDPMIGAGGRNHNNNNNHNAMTNGILPHRRGMPFAKNNAAENFNSNNNTDLFSRSRTSLPAASSDESDLQVRLARLSLGSAKPAKSVLDDLLSNNEGGKNDYDWLLTPPGTPLFPSTDDKESQQPARVTTRSKSSIRSSSINKTSRLSVSQSETNHQPRPARSSSVTRSSISTSQYTNYSNRNTNILNTSSASVSSYIRPSTPTRPTRPSTPSTTRTTTSSRPSTPSRTRPTPTSTHTPTRPSGNTRPSTPTSRPQTPGNVISSSPTIRPPSRSSTPTRRTLTPSLSPSTSSLPSVTRGLSTNGRSVGSTSRPSSPSPRVRPPPQPMNIIDFPHDTPPNLRTTLPDRPLSAGRSRPVGSGSVKGNLESTNSGSITRRHSSPNVVRGRVVPEPSGRGRNGNVGESLEARRSLNLPQSVARKPVKSASSESGTGFGRNISKKSLDMAIKHMDIRNGGPRPLSGSTLFPQSIRSTISRARPGRAQSLDGTGSENGNYTNGYSWNRGGPTEDQSPLSSKLSSEVDIYESSRYDAILLKEDLKNTSWLHSGDDKTTDEGLLFDNGFESLPEPFGPL